MANLTGFNIGANQRGILNIGSVINTPLDTTLRSITDGLGNESPLQLSTNRININALLSIGTTAIPSDTGSGGLYLTDHIVFRGDSTTRTQKAVIFSNTGNARNAAIGSGWYTTFNQNLEFITASTLRGVIDNLGNFSIGTTTASARLQVRGDGTNPVARFENNAGTLSNLFLDSGMLQFGQFGSFVNIYPAVANDLNTAAINGSAMVFRSNVGTNSANSYSYFFRSTNGGSTIQSLAGTNGFINMTGAGISSAAGSANYRHLDIGYSINNSGAQTGVATGIFLNGTETALNGMGHNLIDLQVGGTTRFRINNSGQTIFGGAAANEPYLVNYNGTATESGTGQSLRIRQRANTGATGNTLIQYWADGLFSGTTSGTAISHEFLSSGFAGAAGNTNYRNTSFVYTINNSGANTGTATGIFLNATETALNGMVHNLLDLQVGGNSRFRVTNSGILSVGGLGGSTGEIRFRRSSDGNEVGTVGSGGAVLFVREGQGSGGELQTFDGTAVVRWVGVGSAARLQFGGTTNAFPALKRNAAALEVRLADDSGFANLGGREFSASVGFFAPNSTEVRGTYIRGRVNTFINFSDGTTGMLIDSASGTTANASAILQADSTTKGFLPPRMTEAQRLAIAGGTPAVGLMVYQTDASDGLYVYKTGGWTLIA